MIPSIDIALLSIIVVLAIVAITVKDLLAATMVLGVYSFLMAMVWVEMHSVDVGFTEAAVGAGATTAFLIAALSRTARHEKEVTDKKTKRLPAVALVFIILLGVIFVYIAEDIPAFGDSDSAPNKYVKLFSMDADEIENDLNQGIVPEKLIGRVKEAGFQAPTGVINLRNGEWDAFIIPEETTQHFYPKEQKYYFIKKEGDKLDVYRYSLIVRWVEEGKRETEVVNMVTYGLADYRSYDTLGETAVIFTAGVSVILLLRRRGKL
ncbi:MAG: hypothetical protein EMLJLAPB_00849 [Candidatus Argoarchaeum ethanivorans]|uniref:MrpA C-terminal/MbhD domain-containing protein n=1 Tax=Candidatus Argoarchaeum ethanivorans TaxID=2608793 RepID=A0A811TFV2_9EURY|nr:MAG: hypothetical protein EMLJLAPB_00849 [Candidatus Argoarchaeum ethanivorans]